MDKLLRLYRSAYATDIQYLKKTIRKKNVYRTECTYKCTMQKRDKNGMVNGHTEVTE